MSFDVSALNEYIENRDFPLVGAVQFDPEMTASMATVQPGIKGKSNLHFMETNVVFGDGDNCNRTPAGTTSFEDKTIEVADIEVAEDLCLNDLERKWTQIKLQQGTLRGKQLLPEEIAEIYFEQKRIKTAQELDKADWQGDTASGVNNLNKYDGWIKFIDAAVGDAAAIDGNTGGISAMTVTNIIAAVQAMFLSIPQNIRTEPNLTLFIPWEWYDLYVVALTNANLFHFKGEDGVTMLHGTNIRLKPTFGLNGTNRMFLTWGENLVIGVDGEDDGEYTSRLDPVTEKKVFVDANWTRGTQVYFTEDVVEFTLAAT